MTALNRLLPLALVGTERFSSPWPTWGPEYGDVSLLLQQLAASADAAAALRMAGVLAVCEQAAGPAFSAAPNLPTPAAPDTWAALPDGRLRNALEPLWHSAPVALWHEVFGTLARQRLRLPEAWLPRALALAQRHRDLALALTPVLGERGLWLQRQQSGKPPEHAAPAAMGMLQAAQADAHPAPADETTSALADDLWQHGTLAQRLQWLRQQRQADPAAARALFTASLKSLPAKERAELLETFAVSLSPADETLLDSLRSDRAQAVRQAALRLLLRLPQAAHPQRASKRLAALLQLEGGTWRLEPPAEAGADWSVDQIETQRPPHESLGERAWWLYQMARQVPLAWWNQHTGLDASALRQWARAGDWYEALMRAWTEVLLAAPEPAWIEPWLAKWPAKAPRDGIATLLAQLPLAQREHHWQRQMAAKPDAFPVVVDQALASCAPGQTLSAAFSADLAQRMQAQLRTPAVNHSYWLRPLLPGLVCVLHASSLPTLAPDALAAPESLQTGLPGLVQARLALLELEPSP